LPAVERLRPERLRPATGRDPELAGKEADDALGDVVLLRVRLEIRGIRIRGGEGEGEIADDLRRRRHLRDAPEDAVRGGVVVLDGFEVVTLSDSDGLLPEIRQL